ncbi:MAG: pseudouridine synthase [Proteobacteria bacterium]|nr:pseudouridine synthase [Pseudomonadota bacterium]
MRLNKFLALAGVCSRRDAEKLISDGYVSINGKTVIPPAPLLTGSEVVKVNGKVVTAATEVKVWAFYKPSGLVTTHKDEQDRLTVFDYLKEQGLNDRVISVGRLDLNSEGLLLLTNDGGFAQFAESPKTEWERVYRVRVFGEIQNIDFEKLLDGITIDGVNYRKVVIEPEQDFKHTGKNAWLRVILKEGKNREIRKIMEYFNLQVNRLIRINYGPYSLEKLEPGEWKEVSAYTNSAKAP